MAELLFELGCEELPAHSVRSASGQLAHQISERLTEAGVAHGEVISLGTPRRLIVAIREIPDRQPDQTKSQRGPSLKSAYGSDGNPTKALEGFCRGQGANVSELTNDGEYVWFEKTVQGRPMTEVLAEILPDSVRALTFDKTMRWGSSRMRFARPIRWMLASFGGSLIPFEIEGVQSGLESRGHRFYNPESFGATDLESLLSGLRARKVEPNPAIREEQIRTQATEVADGVPDLPDALVDENVFLTEWPEAIQGEFPEHYLELPEPILVTAMAKHQRFFPVRDEGGMITNRFIAIRNAGVADAVRAGNQWVLNARFNDARFFFADDATKSLSDFLERTSRMAFQDKLGTVRQRADRLSQLMDWLAEATGQNRDWARAAGLFAKADLSSGLVSEFASLQGVIGAHYADREEMPNEVVSAIGGHYDLPEHAPQTPGEFLALLLLVADQIDKLVGFVGVGHVPSGSSDPFGLRRAATYLIQSCWLCPAPIDLPGAIAASERGFAAQGIDLPQPTRPVIDEIFEGRYAVLLPDVRYDLLEAALTPDALLDPAVVKSRVEILPDLADDIRLVQAASRPFNILAAAEKKGISIPGWSPTAATLLVEPSEKGLIAAVDAAEPKLTERGDTVGALAALAGPIDSFFDAVMVMDERAEYRDARLALLGRVRRLFARCGDMSKIVVEG